GNFLLYFRLGHRIFGGFPVHLTLRSTSDHLPLDRTSVLPLSTTSDHILRLNAFLSRKFFGVTCGNRYSFGLRLPSTMTDPGSCRNGRLPTQDVVFTAVVRLTSQLRKEVEFPIP